MADGENEIGNRTGRDDGGALPDGLAVEIAGIIGGLGHLLRIRHAGGIGVALEFHIAAERDPRQFPTRAMLVVPAGDFLAEADGEGLDAHAAPARHEEMPQLVDEDDDRQGAMNGMA